MEFDYDISGEAINAAAELGADPQTYETLNQTAGLMDKPEYVALGVVGALGGLGYELYKKMSGSESEVLDDELDESDLEP